MATKAKKKVHSMPKLGWKDMLLYWTAMVGLGLFIIAGFFIPMIIRNQIAFADTSVLAAAPDPGNIGFLWLPLLCCVPWVMIYSLFQRRIPVFGRSDIKYGPPAYPRIYPVFMKNKPQFWVSQKEVKRKKRIRLIIAGLLIIAFSICIPLYISSPYPRSVLYSNGSVSVYDTSNELVETYHPGEISYVELTTDSSAYKGKVSWFIVFNIHLENGKIFSFSINHFQGSSTQALESMLYAKENLFGDRLWISGTEDLPQVIVYRCATAQDEQLVYKLFDMES